MQDTGLLRPVQTSRVGRDQQICGRVATFCFKPLEQCIGLACHQVDADTRLFGKFVEKRLDKLFIARRVEIHLAGSACEERRQNQRHGCEKRDHSFHGCLRNRLNSVGME